MASKNVHPTSSMDSLNVKGVNHLDVGTDFNGDWPADGFLLPGTSTADQGEGRGQYVQGSNGRGRDGWKGSREGY